jgi:membrane protein implicated in regulation of membrane protease activity
VKKITDFLLEVFMWAYSLFLLSIALPIALGLLSAVGGLAMIIREHLDGFGNWQWVIYLFTGLGLKILWHDKRLKEGEKKASERG